MAEGEGVSEVSSSLKRMSAGMWTELLMSKSMSSIRLF